MDKIIFSISKTDKNDFVVENKMDKKTYKFSDFSEIVDVFSNCDEPQFSGYEQGKIPRSRMEKIDIHKRVVKDKNQMESKFFWSRSYNKFDQFEKPSVMEVLLHVKKNMKGW